MASLEACVVCQKAGRRKRGHLSGKCPYPTPPTPTPSYLAESKSSQLQERQPVNKSATFTKAEGDMGSSFDLMLETVEKNTLEAKREEQEEEDLQLAETVAMKEQALRGRFNKFANIVQFSGTSNPEALKENYVDAIKYAAFPGGEVHVRSLIDQAGSVEVRTIFEHVLALAEAERENILAEIRGEAEMLSGIRKTATGENSIVKNSDVDSESFIHDQVQVVNSTVRTSEIFDNATVTGGAFVQDSRIGDRAAVSYYASVKNSHLSGSAYVGAAVVENCNLSGSVLIYPQVQDETFTREENTLTVGSENPRGIYSDLRGVQRQAEKGTLLDRYGRRLPVIKNVKMDRGFIGSEAYITRGTHVKTWVDEKDGTLYTRYPTVEVGGRFRQKFLTRDMVYSTARLLSDGSYAVNRYPAYKFNRKLAKRIDKYGVYAETVK